MSQLVLFLENSLIKFRGEFKWPIVYIIPNTPHCYLSYIKRLNSWSKNAIINITTTEPISPYPIWDKGGGYQKWYKYWKRNYVSVLPVRGTKAYTFLIRMLLYFLSFEFQISEGDYAAVLQVKINKEALSKAYVVLFTLTVARTCHLEQVADLTSQSLLYAHRRFTSRKRFPQIHINEWQCYNICKCCWYLESLKHV